jgi:molecular chaperone Hsp33
MNTDDRNANNKKTSDKPANDKPASDELGTEKTASEKTASEKTASDRTAEGIMVGDKNVNNRTIESQRVHRFVSNDFAVRVASVNATAVVAKMQQLQQTRPLPTVAVGRALVGALLMASQLKEGQEVGILIQGEGELSRVYAQADFHGKARGYVNVPQFEPPSYSSVLSLREAIGGGMLTVVRHQPFQRQPYQGTVPLVSGEIGEDLAFYLHQSQQIRSVISLGVFLDTYGRVEAAGGVLIEVMPGVEGNIIDKIEENQKRVSTEISKLIRERKTSVELVQPYLEGIPFTEIPHPHPIDYSCRCSAERVKNALTILGIEELDDMIAKQETSQIVCEMCGRPYQLTLNDIQEVRNALFKSSLH